MAKASAAGATHYVPEGGEVPDLPGVRLVGPGAPIHDALQRRRLAEAQAAAAVEQPASEPGPADSGEDTAAAAGETAGEAAAEQPQGTGSGGDDDSPADYASYPKTVLVDLCRERGLPVTGTKAELAARLASYDQERL